MSAGPSIEGGFHFAHEKHALAVLRAFGARLRLCCGRGYRRSRRQAWRWGWQVFARGRRVLEVGAVSFEFPRGVRKESLEGMAEVTWVGVAVCGVEDVEA
jgi:hypothetical protein